MYLSYLSLFPRQHPEFYKVQAMRLSTFGKPRIIACAEDHSRHIGLPRGCLEEVQALLADLHIQVDVRDKRFAGEPLEVTFQGQLRPEQLAAARKMLAHETGVLSATTAFGKTVVAAWLIAKRGVNTLVLVHRRQLLDQWIKRLLQEHGYFVLRFLAEDVGTKLDMVLDAILQYATICRVARIARPYLEALL